MLLVITISTFICISFGVMGLYWLVYRPQSAATERLRKLNEKGESEAPVSIAEEHPVADFAERFAAPLNRLVPPSAAEVRKLQGQLMQAGFRAPSAPIIF